MRSNDFDEIMREITSGLSGDHENDIKYLREKSEEYKDHELGKEIIRACGRMMFELLPDDAKEEIGSLISKENKGLETTMEEVRFNIYKKDFDKALQIIEPLILKHEELNMFNNDSVSEYYCFDEPFEEILYRKMNNTEKTFRRAEIDYAEMYLTYGSLLFEMKRNDDAISALKKAMRWNPANAFIAFEHAENYKIKGDIETFKELTKKIFKIAFRRKTLARCYRNMGYYFVEKQMYSEAMNCYYFSLMFEDSPSAQSELFYISSQTGVELKDPSKEELENTFRMNDIPFGADDDVLKIAYTYGKACYESGEYEPAEYFLEIVREFIDDDNIDKMIGECNEKKN